MAETRTSIYVPNDVYDIVSDFCSQQNTTISAFARWSITKALVPEIISRYELILDEYNRRRPHSHFSVMESEENVWVLVNDNTEDLVLLDLRNYDVDTFITIDILATHLERLQDVSNGYYVGLE